MIGNLDIVERSMLDRILGEAKLGETGVIDPETATKVGKIAGVDAIVTGTITDLQSYVSLNCRLIDTRTGRIFGAAQAKIVKDDDVRKIMGAPLPASAGGMQRQSSGSASGSTGKQIPVKSNQQQQANGFLFELKECTLSGSSVECDLFITNNKSDRGIRIYSGGRSSPSRLIDADGLEHLAEDISIGGAGIGGGRSSPVAQMATGIPVRTKLAFESVSPDTELARLVEISCFSEGPFSVQFRNVPLVRP